MNVQRHDLVFVSPSAWHALVASWPDLADEPIVAEWVDRDWPLVARRAAADEHGGLALGLPLPPALGKRRLSVTLGSGDVASIARPLPLAAAIGVAPVEWRTTLRGLVATAAVHGVEAHVFGSLAWNALTGLEYVTDRSDLDLLLPMSWDTDAAALTADIAAIEANAPMRLDGELVREDGAAVNWREIHSGAREVLVKTARGVELCDARRFLGGEAWPS